VGSDANGYAPIADYALIGDCHTAALVSKSGSIDWYCPGRFDASPVLWRILDARKGGFFSVAPPQQAHQVSRRYRGPTNVLETTFQLGGGRLRITDFMPVHRRHQSRLGHDVGTTSQILRLVEAEGQGCAVEVRFKPAFDFGRAQTRVSGVRGKGVVATDGGRYLVLYCGKCELGSADGNEVRGQIELRAGERAWLALSLAGSEHGAHAALDPDVSQRDLQRTLEYWEDWAARCRYDGRYREPVLRSALALKLLTYEPTGAVVAAPTTSLPELIGGIRNWDYRFTWLRDASLMLYALSTLGYHEEGTDFIGWLAKTIGNDPTPRPQIMYTIDGGHELSEEILDRVDGYKGSRPVRVGNGAYRQHQLDIYGDVLDAAHQFRRIEEAPDTPVPAPANRLSRRSWQLLSRLVEQAIGDWQEPDSGIWEVRGGLRHFVYSKLMCWVAVDRGLRLAQEHRLKAPLARWQQACEDIRTAILERGFNRELQAFTQSFDDDHLDSSVLAMPRYGFLPATDPRFQSTVDAIRGRLMRNGLLRRYEAHEGLITSGPEATFVLSSFWLVDALALGGRLDEARELFECLIGYTNDVGLLAEEIDPDSSTDRLLGNFPQGFSHMALIGSAVNLSVIAKEGPEVVPQTPRDRAAQASPAVADPDAS
jgi:GH15 family glucan-1,4-alpha-glucosidase